MHMLRVLVSLLLFIPLALTAAERYPVKPVRIVVGFPPGGSDDTHARLLAQKMTEAFGRQMVVDNRPGAGGIIGQDSVAKAAPDGYTLLFAGPAIVIAPNLYPKMPYDLMRDLTPVSRVATFMAVLVVHPSVPAKSVKELIALARSRPGKLNFASSGAGAVPHLNGELFKQMAKVDITHIPYKGGAPALVDLIGGQVDMYFSLMGSAMSYIAAGKVRPLAVTSAARSKALPDVPTMAEAGLPLYDLTGWYAIMAPSATPRDIISQLNAAVVNAVGSPDLQERLFKLGSEPAISTPEQMLLRLREDMTKFSQIIRTAGVKLDL
jgi:tripartite-type tricarboxylate transporter receptor subunit TctC